MDGGSPRILKRGTPAAAGALARPDAVLAAARAQAEELVAAANAEAATVRARAASDADAARRIAIEEGHVEGMGRAASALALAARVRDEALASLEGSVSDAALAVARRLVDRELAADPGLVLALARRALRSASALGDVLLRVAPGDLPILRQAQGTLGELLGRGSLTLAEDPSLGRGEVIVEAAGGRIDARIEARLDAFRRALEAEPA